ncbi:unnamed protein product [Rotaria sp. Silwood2]|nr:unnamed protein product [Rotaria sp. Silwood2]CAF4228286.1 unnamed protein product [Rotaria sp. Silwood2]
MIEGHLYIFPLLVCILVPIAYLISFIVAIHLGHSKFEYSFFSYKHFCFCLPVIITIYIRYRQIAELIRNHPTCGKKCSQLNLTFLTCGMITAFSMSIIANFPHSNVFLVRILATYITFITSVGALYCEMLLSFWIRPLLYSSRILPFIRMILSIICTFIFIIFIIFQTITIIKYDNQEKLWTSISPGWKYHFGSSLSTWILTSCLLIYISTLIIDFRRIKIISPKIYLTTDIIDDQMNHRLSFSI